MSTIQSMQVDEAKLQAFMGKVVSDMGAPMSGALVLIGDKLDLYQALAEGGGATPDMLARRTGTAERYVCEWLAAQAASGYVEYGPLTQRFAMSAEQAMALAAESSPVYVAGAFALARAWAGTSTTSACSAAWIASSVAAARHSSSRTGVRPWMA